MRRALVGLLLLSSGACTPAGTAVSAQESAGSESPAAPEVAPPGAAPIEPEVLEEPEAPPEPPQPEAPQPETCASGPVTELPAHPDLAIVLKSKGRRPSELGQPINVVASIRNGSKRTPHFAVLSGDGSQAGWREPHVWYSGFVDTGDGCWQPLPRLEPGRCGMYDEDWRDEVVELGPGKSAELEWLSSPATALDIPPAGRVRLFLHYAYRAGKTTRGTVSDEFDPELGAMKGVDAFELVSNPIEFELRPSLELRLSTRPHRGLGNVSKISDLVDVKLENVGRKARKVMPPTANTLHFEVDDGAQIRPTWNAGDEMLPTHRLASGDSVPLLGPSSPNAALVVNWYPPGAEVIRIRASYQPYGEVGASPLRSNWVEVDLR